MLDCPRGGLCCHASLCLHAHTDPPGRLCAFVWDSVSTIFQNGHNKQHIISEKGQQRKESKLIYIMEEKCWLLLSFKPMVKHRKTVLQIIATLTRVCLHCDGLDTPPTEKRKLWIICLCGFVLPNLYRVLCQHFFLCQIPLWSPRNPPLCISHYPHNIVSLWKRGP